MSNTICLLDFTNKPFKEIEEQMDFKKPRVLIKTILSEFILAPHLQLFSNSINRIPNKMQKYTNSCDFTFLY